MLKRASEARSQRIRTTIFLVLVALVCSQLAAEASSNSSRRSRPPGMPPRPRMRTGSGSSSGYGETRRERPAEKMIKVTVLDEQGKEVEGALVGAAILDNEVPTDELPFGHLDIAAKRTKTMSSIGGTNSTSGSSAFFGSAKPTSHTDRGPVVALDKTQNLCALGEVSDKDLGGEITLKLQPACRVFGQLTCSALVSARLCLVEGTVDVYWKGYNPLRCQDKPRYGFRREGEFFKPTFDFEFFLPPGEYGVLAKSSSIAGEKRVVFAVKPGQSEFNIGTIDLPAASAATLIGKAAPPIGPVGKWLNGTPVEPGKTNGKPILLCFGHVPDVRRSGSRTSSSLPPNPGGSSPRQQGGGFSFSTSPNTTTRSFTSPPQGGGFRSNEFFRRLGVNQRGGSQGGGAGGGGIDYKTLSIEQLTTPAKLFGKDLEIVAFYPHDSEAQVEAMLAEVKANSRGRIAVSVAAGDASGTCEKYGVTENLTIVLIDGRGKVAGAFDHVPCGEEIERALGIELPWRKDFAKQYGLGAGEAVKHIERPSLGTRLGYWRSSPGAIFSPEPPASILFAIEDGRPVEKKTVRGMPNDVQESLALILGVDAVRFELGYGPPMIDIKGDWVYRPEAPYPDKAAKVEKILSANHRRDVILIRHAESLATIKVFGDYRYQPLSANDTSGVIRVFAETSNAQTQGPAASADSVMRMLRDICREAQIDVVIEAGDYKSGPVRYTLSPELAQLSKLPTWEETKRRLRMILDNISAQTNLKFTLDVKPRDVVVIREQQ